MSSETSRFDVIGHEIPIDNKGVRIVPVGDIHANAPMFAGDVFDAWCQSEKKISKEIPTYYIGVGDYLETMSGTERKALVAMHESTQEWLDEQVVADVDKLAKRLEWTKGRWLGMLAGNHTYTTQDGYTLTDLLADRLDARALGICAGIRLYMLHGNSALIYDVWAYHGRGGGQLAGATINAIERWASGLDADLVIMGHDHKRGAIPTTRLSIFGKRNERLDVRQKEVWLVRTGSFLKGYEPGKVSYIASRALKPASLGTTAIKLSVSRGRVCPVGDGDHRDTKIITQVTI